MSFPVPSVPATTLPWSLPDAPSGGYDGPFTLWSVPGSSSALVGSISLFIDYSEATFGPDVYVLTLLGQNNEVLYTQPTSVFLSGTDLNTSFQATWAIGANDTAQLPAFQVAEVFAFTPFAWATLPLPNMVLPPLSQVALTAIRGIGGVDGVGVSVSGFVSYTPAGGVSETMADLTPFLLPVTNG